MNILYAWWLLSKAWISTSREISSTCLRGNRGHGFLTVSPRADRENQVLVIFVFSRQESQVTIHTRRQPVADRYYEYLVFRLLFLSTCNVKNMHNFPRIVLRRRKSARPRNWPEVHYLQPMSFELEHLWTVAYSTARPVRGGFLHVKLK